MAPSKMIRVKANSNPWFDCQTVSAIQRRDELCISAIQRRDELCKQYKEGISSVKSSNILVKTDKDNFKVAKMKENDTEEKEISVFQQYKEGITKKG